MLATSTPVFVTEAEPSAMSGVAIGRAPDSSARRGFSTVPSNHDAALRNCHAAASATTNGPARASWAKKMAFASAEPGRHRHDQVARGQGEEQGDRPPRRRSDSFVRLRVNRVVA